MTDNPLGNPVPELPCSTSPLTWAGLLAHWVQLAQAASILPDDILGTSWKQSVAPAITLHAVAMALGELQRLDADERALALDRAAILINRESNALAKAWRENTLPTRLDQLVLDAREAFERALTDSGTGA